MTETDLSKFIARTNCPRKFARLELSDMRSDGMRDYRAALKRIDAVSDVVFDLTFLREPVFILISGPFGSGKTRAACWILRRAYEGLSFASTLSQVRGVKLEEGRIATVVPRGLDPLFLRASQLAELRFRSLNREEESEDEDRRDVLRDRLRTTSLLVIDDVARVAGYRGEEQFVESVIERRWEDDRSVILTGNMDEGEGEGDRTSTLSPRFRDFLKYFDVISLTGGTRRGS